MINKELTNQIILHIDKLFGINAVVDTNILEPLTSRRFLLSKQLRIELDDGSSVTKNLWAAMGQVSNSTLKTLIADITIDNDQREYLLLFQLDDLSIYVVKMSDSEHSCLKVFSQNIWVDLSMLLQAKFLMGMEFISENLVTWNTLKDYDVLYKHMISFLKLDDNQSE